MQEDEASPTMARGLLRLGTLFAAIAVVSGFLWSIFSETAALYRLDATAKSYHYELSCDAEGRIVSEGSANCVDLNLYIFINGPVMKAIRRECTGKPAATLIFEKGVVARTEINLVRKLLEFHARFGTNSPC